MAKVKTVNRSTISSAGKKKTKHATPTKASKGKIQKNQKIDKGEKMQNELIRDYYEIQSKVRLCFVRIKRYNGHVNRNSKDSLDQDINCVQHDTITSLPNQCTDCIDTTNTDVPSKAKKNVHRKMTQLDGNNNTISSTDINIMHYNDLNVVRSKNTCALVNKNMMEGDKELSQGDRVKTFLDDRGRIVANITNSQCNVECLTKKCIVKIKRLPMTTIRPKKCVVKIKRLSMTSIRPKKCVVKIKRLPMTSIRSKKCIVKIKRLPMSTIRSQTIDTTLLENKIITKANVFQSQLNGEYSSMPVKKCVVKIKKLPMSSLKDLKARKAAKETLLASQIISPTLDNEKRKAFGKLSLSMHSTFKKDDKIKRVQDSIDKTNENIQLKKNLRPTVRRQATSTKSGIQTKVYSTRSQEHNNCKSKSSANLPDIEENKTIKQKNITHENNLKSNINDTNKEHIDTLVVDNDADKKSKNDMNITKDKSRTTRSKTNKILKGSKCGNSIDITTPSTRRCKPKNVTFSESTELQLTAINKTNKIYNSSKVLKPIIQKTQSKESDKNNGKEGSNEGNFIVFKKPNNINDKIGKEIFSKQTRNFKDDTHAPKEQSKNVNNINISLMSEFLPQRNSTMSCELLRHLTVVDEISDNNETEISCDGITNANGLKENQTKTFNRTNKFFHRHEEESSETSSNPNDIVHNKKARLKSRKTSLVRREKVYDFLSQSQTSDSDGQKCTKPMDPTADIIKKLISEGKVSVAISRKGTGKTFIRPNRKKTKKSAVKIPNRNAKRRENGKPPIENGKQNAIIELDDYGGDDHFMDNDDDDNYETGFAEPSNNKIKNTNLETIAKGSTLPDQEGTFSNLARSVLITQAKRNDAERLKAQRLLSIAKKLISTPNNKNVPSMRKTIGVDYSPIPGLTSVRPTKASPWRVDEDAHLPRVFNFSRSSGNLPSYSSDFIPPTPKKDKTSMKTNSQIIEVTKPQQSLEEEEMAGIMPLDNPCSTPLVAHGVSSSIPSFSSNDSNAENKTPPGIENQQTNDENANIFNIKQLPNPRRALNYRSPLKAINITEVVHLQRLDMEKILNVNKTTEIDTPKVSTRNTNNEKTINQAREDLFGFEEFLSQTDISIQEDVPIANETNTKPDEKRHRLGKLKPDTRELQISLQQANKAITKDKHLFADHTEVVAKTQRTVKEMLCSTMIPEKPTTSRKAGEDQHKSYKQSTNGSGLLFKDFEPETTFNEEDPHRTYIRPYKRKRRLNEKRIIFALESDESDVEENGGNLFKKTKQPNNRSRETDTSTENQAPRNKKKKRQRKEKPEYVNFVTEFNEMCKEVENYELIVEKSA